MKKSICILLVIAIMNIFVLSSVVSAEFSKTESGNIYKNTTVVTSGIVSTGMTINNYTIIVKGDVTGDGYAKMNDVMMISKFIVESTGLTSNTKQAADVTSDNSIKMNDVMKISKYIVEGGSL